MIRRALAAVAAAIVAAGLAIAGSGGAALVAVGSATRADAHPRAVVLVASDDYAIYQVRTRATNLTSGDYYGGDLYAIGSTGKKRALTTFRDGPPGLALVRDSLVQAKNHTTEHYSYYTVHYLDLASGQQGTVTLAPGDAEMTAAPGGFVRGHRPGLTGSYGDIVDLELQAYSGKVAQLGTPYLDGRVYSLVAGDSGLIATTSTSDDLPDLDATIRYMSWSRPGVWTTIYNPHEAVYLTCAPPSATSVACSVTATEGNAASRFGLIALRARKVVWLTKARPMTCSRLDYATYGSNLVAIETSNADGCTDGTLLRLGANGALAVSAKRYSGRGAITVGLGRMLVSSSQQRDICSLTGVTKRPHILARA